VRTELHFHLLPGVDDGPRDHVEALELARLALADGTRRIVLTPHVRELELTELAARTEEVRARLTEAGVALDICRGGELSPDDLPSMTQAELELLAHGPPGRRWVLIEAPLWAAEPDLHWAAAELRARGFELLIAHPERSTEVTPAEIAEQVRIGARLQINASSLAGIHGPAAERTALSFARSGLPFVLASDAHSPARPPLLTRGAEALAAGGVPAETIRAAVDSGPARLLSEGLRHPLHEARLRAG
jgi:protein-tyrosine phosphatase